ncbi:MAG: FAD-dependent oxidoreductase [Propionibacteriaceae bacterium]|jgi:glycine/D-amino acid oxidase-like deaminating enzyme|nr:FAD-dependent oxidoreductase [Propionibacteriaceae bacterium]
MKLAIVGAGAAGTIAAYRLRQALPDATITVFERAAVPGGRAHQVEFAGTQVEVGATVMHSSGQWLSELADYAGIAKGTGGVQLDGKDEVFGFWDGRSFSLTTKSSMFSLAWGIVRKYGLMAALRTTRSTRELAAKWSKIYELQRAGQLFDTTDELLKALDIKQAQATSLRDVFSSAGVDAGFIQTVIEGITRNMYTQDGRMNSFAGRVGLAGAGLAGGSLYAIPEGNQTLFAKALVKLGVELRLNTEVNRISALGSSVVAETDGAEESFDAAIIAAPLELADLKVFFSQQRYNAPMRPYQEVWVTLVAGELSEKYFRTRKLPSMVFCANTPQAQFASLGVCGFSPQHKQRIYKFFTVGKPLPAEEVVSVFSKVYEVGRWHWPGAYPVLSPGLHSDPFKLWDRLYYVNGFESAASTLELDAVAAYNTAGLLLRDLA